ncbi:hypothetical protein [Streptomyces sp. B15]|uniref:hypothetical protein n=1 Tax=Streptomyces sp. B15 TaxID=1537797 RepID=UPI001B3612CC|nr:hypothetical protein [Streptomyces sp. B15]MBQ1122587.1 hypothetical protein [Streptomyces sp. B15]
MSAQPIEQRRDCRATADNRLAVETAIEYLALPASTLTPRPDAVHVTVVDVYALSEWMYKLGGDIPPAVSSGDGAVMVTLRTKTPERADGSTVDIRVHVVAVDGDDVLIDVRRGVPAHV